MPSFITPKTGMFRHLFCCGSGEKGRKRKTMNGRQQEANTKTEHRQEENGGTVKLKMTGKEKIKSACPRLTELENLSLDTHNLQIIVDQAEVNLAVENLRNYYSNLENKSEVEVALAVESQGEEELHLEHIGKVEVSVLNCDIYSSCGYNYSVPELSLAEIENSNSDSTPFNSDSDNAPDEAVVTAKCQEHDLKFERLDQSRLEYQAEREIKLIDESQEDDKLSLDCFHVDKPIVVTDYLHPFNDYFYWRNPVPQLKIVDFGDAKSHFSYCDASNVTASVETLTTAIQLDQLVFSVPESEIEEGKVIPLPAVSKSQSFLFPMKAYNDPQYWRLPHIELILDLDHLIRMPLDPKDPTKKVKDKDQTTKISEPTADSSTNDSRYSSPSMESNLENNEKNNDTLEDSSASDCEVPGSNALSEELFANNDNFMQMIVNSLDSSYFQDSSCSKDNVLADSNSNTLGHIRQAIGFQKPIEECGPKTLDTKIESNNYGTTLQWESVSLFRNLEPICWSPNHHEVNTTCINSGINSLNVEEPVLEINEIKQSSLKDANISSSIKPYLLENNKEINSSTSDTGTRGCLYSISEGLTTDDGKLNQVAGLEKARQESPNDLRNTEKPKNIPNKYKTNGPETNCITGSDTANFRILGHTQQAIGFQKPIGECGSIKLESKLKIPVNLSEKPEPIHLSASQHGQRKRAIRTNSDAAHLPESGTFSQTQSHLETKSDLLIRQSSPDSVRGEVNQQDYDKVLQENRKLKNLVETLLSECSIKDLSNQIQKFTSPAFENSAESKILVPYLPLPSEMMINQISAPLQLCPSPPPFPGIPCPFPSPPGIPCPPPPPGMPGQPHPPKMALQSYVARKQVVIPKTEMKNLYWKAIRTPIPIVELDGDLKRFETCWEKIDEVKLEDCVLDNFTKLFSRPVDVKELKENAEGSITVDETRKPKVVIPRKVSVLEYKRQLNVGIFVKSNKLEDISRISDAIIEFGTSELSNEIFQQILEIKATDEEIILLKSYVDNNPDVPLDKADKFLFDLNSLPNFTERIACILFQDTFMESLKAIGGKLSTFGSLCQKLMQSPELHKILALVLTFGNYMNGGNKQRGQADGFALDVLPKLKDIKSKDNSYTFLHYIVAQYITMYDDKHGKKNSKMPLPERSEIDEASELKFEAIGKELMTLTNNLQDCEKQTEDVINSSTEHALEPFKTKMTKFLGQANEKLKEVDQDFSKTKETFISCMNFFYHIPKKGVEFWDPSGFLAPWKDFCSDFKDIWYSEQEKAFNQKSIEEKKKIFRDKVKESNTQVTEKVSKDKMSQLRAKMRRKQNEED